MKSQYPAVSLNKIPMVAVIMREGARSLERDYIDVGKFYKISKKKFFMKILLPQLYPYYFHQLDQACH